LRTGSSLSDSLARIVRFNRSGYFSGEWQIAGSPFQIRTCPEPVPGRSVSETAFTGIKGKQEFSLCRHDPPASNAHRRQNRFCKNARSPGFTPEKISGTHPFSKTKMGDLGEPAGRGRF